MKHIKTAVLFTAMVCLVCSLCISPATAAPAFNCETATTGVPLAECEALVAFYESTNGDNWTNTKQYKDVWFSAQAVSLWYGVTVQSGHVHDIDLVNNNLTGTLPLELGDLEALWTLNLEGNQLHGSIPGSLFEIPDIHEIDLSNNLLSGPIPGTIGSPSAPDLVKFIADHNNLSGVIPSSVGSVPELNTLILGNNDLYGPIPVSLTNLTYLTTLDLTYNGLWVTDPTLKTFVNTKNPTWSTTQSAQGLYPANDGYAGWGSGTGYPKFIFSQAWFDSPYKYTANEYRVRIYRKYDNFQVFSESKIAYLIDGNPDNDMCPNYTDWTIPGTCSFIATSSPSLVPGEEYYWTVETFKEDMTFVQLDSQHYFIVPPAPESFQPQGIVAVNNPAFTWTPVQGVEKYYLWFGDSATNKVKEAMVDPSACTESLCTYKFITTSIAGNEYFWKVSGVMNSTLRDYTAFSEIKSFIRRNPPELIKPTGNAKITAKNPLFSWKPVEDAIEYRITVYRGSSPVMESSFPSPTCASNTCSKAIGLSLANGDYSWQVIAHTGTWGDADNPGYFSKLSPPAPKFPATSTTVKNPKFIWSKVAGQTQYRLVVMNPSGLVIRDKVISSPNCSAATNTCSYTFTGDQSLSLVDGASFKWKVKSFNGIWGDYSSPKTFKKLAPPAVVSPINTITATNPKFTWKKIPGATEYTIELRKSTGVLVKTMKVTKINCDAGNCWYYSSNIPLNLAAGSYKWRVKAFNGYYGPYGLYKAFTKK